MCAVAAGQADKLIAVDQWMAGIAPQRDFRVYSFGRFFFQTTSPELALKQMRSPSAPSV